MINYDYYCLFWTDNEKVGQNTAYPNQQKKVKEVQKWKYFLSKIPKEIYIQTHLNRSMKTYINLYKGELKVDFDYIIKPFKQYFYTL